MNNNRIYSARKNPLPLKYSTKIFNRNLKKQYFLTCIFSSLFLPYKVISLKQTYLHVVILKSTFKHEKFNCGLKYGSIFLECLYYFVNYIIFSIFYIFFFYHRLKLMLFLKKQKIIKFQLVYKNSYLNIQFDYLVFSVRIIIKKCF